MQLDCLLDSLAFLSPGDLDSLELVDRRLSLMIASHTRTLPGRKLVLEYKPYSLLIATSVVKHQPQSTNHGNIMQWLKEYPALTVDMTWNSTGLEILEDILRDPKLACVSEFSVSAQPTPADLQSFTLLVPATIPPLLKGRVLMANSDRLNAADTIRLLIEGTALTYHYICTQSQ